MKILCIALLMGVLPVGAQASMPQGAVHGAWHVISISSISGVGGNDASVMMTQEIAGDDLTIRWDEGGHVVISVDIDDCFADEDFEQSYAVPLSAWQALSRKARARHLTRTFATWVEQARLSCKKSKSADKFKVGSLTRASDDFNRRLDYFSPPGEPSTALSN
ncbi:MAG: hypothetical protein WA793_07300 [Sphingorhabdus sp.]|uniref:hypothetical protein n=1 Tax=Sphingorhabdus sp. TaxID=1902408 RepID=UPI003CB263CD